MADAIIDVLTWINDMILGIADDKSVLTGSINDFLPELYGYTHTVMESVVLPIAYVVLALFFVLELYKTSIRVDGMGGGSATFGTEVVFRVLFKVVLCKLAVDSVPLILNAIYDVSTHITQGVAGIVDSGSMTGGIDTEAIRPIIEEYGFWSKLMYLILCFIVFLISMVAVAFSYIIIVARFIELFVYFAIAPIPVATLPSDEMSSIGKNFLKSFAAVCIQGTLIFLVLSFFPSLLNSAFLTQDISDSLFVAILGVMGYSLVLIIAVFSTGKWARSICNAM